MKEQRKRVIGYVRVSVDNDEKVSPEIQSEAIERYCESCGRRVLAGERTCDCE